MTAVAPGVILAELEVEYQLYDFSDAIISPMAKTSRVIAPAPVDPQRLMINWLVALAVVILLGGLWTWYQYVHRSTYGVFWDTVNNSLNINGVTRTVEQAGNGGQMKQTLQLSLGQHNLARGVTTITQPNQQDDGQLIIQTEIVGTPTTNFARYVGISGITPSSQADLASVKDIWSQETVTKGQFGQNVFIESIFGSIPFGDLNAAQRQELVQFMKDNKVYDVDYRGAKVVNRDGKQAYEYNVKVNIPAYIASLVMLDDMLGLGQLTGVDPATSEGTAPAELTVVASIDGRQLLEIGFVGAPRTEKYSAYGVHVDGLLPEAVLPRVELEQKVQKLFAPVGS